FAKPDYFLSPGAANCSTPCVSVNPAFAYNHGDYAAEINTNYLGLAGPGVRHLGLDGTSAANGPNSAGPNSGQTEVVNSGTTGTWVDETDIRPTLIYLTGLKDDYEHGGRVRRPADRRRGRPDGRLQGHYLRRGSAARRLRVTTSRAAVPTLMSGRRRVHAAGCRTMVRWNPTLARS